jgi:hypothetical protein
MEPVPGTAGQQLSRAGRWVVHTNRPDPRVTLFDVSLAAYHEYFFVTVGERSVSITMYDTSDGSYPEPQVFTFAKPYGWRTDLGDDEALLQVWQAAGVQR